MDNKTTLDLGGPGFLLFVVFLVLKLTKVIAWSWVWVTAPLWLPLGAIVLLMVVVLVLTGVFGGILAFLNFLTKHKKS